MINLYLKIDILNITYVRHQYFESVLLRLKNMRKVCAWDADGLLGGHSVYFDSTADTDNRFSSFDFDSVDFTLGTPMFQTASHDSEHRYPKLYLEIWKTSIPCTAETAHLGWEETDVHFLFIASRTKWLNLTDNGNYRKTINIPTLSIPSLFTIHERDAIATTHWHLQFFKKMLGFLGVSLVSVA